MIRELIEKEASAVRKVAAWMRSRVRPKTAMKQHAFDRPLDDLGQTIDDVERRTEPQPGSRPESGP